MKSRTARKRRIEAILKRRKVLRKIRKIVDENFKVHRRKYNLIPCYSFISIVGCHTRSFREKKRF